MRGLKWLIIGFAMVLLLTAPALAYKIGVGTKVGIEMNDTHGKSQGGLGLEVTAEISENNTNEKESEVEKEYRGHVGVKVREEIREKIRELKELRKEKLEEIRERIKEKIEKQKELNQKRMRIEKEFRNEIEGYKKYRQLALKLGLQNREGFEYAKLYVFHGLYATINFLNLVKVDINASKMPEESKERVISEIDSIIGALQELAEKVNNTTNPEELRTTLKEIRDYWIEVKPKVRIYGELLVISKLYDVVERAEMIGMNLKANATEDVQGLLDEYFEHLENVKGLLENATEKIVNGEDAMNEINEARKELNLAFNTLKDVYRTMGKERFREGLALGNETGQLWAEVEGNISLTGHVIVTLRGEGTIEVNRDAVVTVVGLEKVGEENETVIYEGEGLMIAKGDVNLTVTGEFKIFVKGKGVVYLEGEGDYRVKPLPEEEMVTSEFEGNETIVIGEWP